MITSIFKKSKPINFIIVAVSITALFIVFNSTTLFSSFLNFLWGFLKLLIILFSVFLLDFIIAKNNLNQKNGYAIMIFVLLFALFPSALKNANLLIANLFLLLAIRRLISLHSKSKTIKKLFDAGLWVGLATVFYFWSILFFALILVALIYYAQNDIKKFMIPFIGLATIMIILVTYNIVFNDSYILESNFTRLASIDYTPYNSASYILSLTVLLSVFLWVLIYYFRVINDKHNNLRPIYFLIAWTSIISVLVAIIAPFKDGSEYIFLFVPFSIITANYIESITENWFKEVFVSLLIVTPIISLLL